MLVTGIVMRDRANSLARLVRPSDTAMTELKHMIDPCHETAY